MRKLWIAASLLLMLISGACAAATQESAPATVATQVPASTAVEAATPVAVEAEVTPTIVDFTASAPASCTVVSSLPEPDPTQTALFPPVTEGDLVFGPPDAAVTILEYSDFQ